MAKDYDEIELSICTDCACWHANADTSGIDNSLDEKRVRQGLGVRGMIVAVTGEDSYFSWRNCDACRRPLGGDRIDAVGLVKKS